MEAEKLPEDKLGCIIQIEDNDAMAEKKKWKFCR